MTAHHIYYQFFITSMLDGWNEPDINRVDPSDNKLIWQLRPRFGCNYYVCMSALQYGAREDDCSTPLFAGREIPDYVLDWMDSYAKHLQVGAAWQRSQTRNRK